MRVRVEDEARTGEAVDLPECAARPDEFVAAVRGEPSPVTVACPPPGPAHEYVGRVEPGMSLSLRAALAAAARSQGRRPPQADRIEELEAALSTRATPALDLAPLRERVAETGGAESGLRERVASLRGRVRTLRERGLDANEAESELRDAARRLSEAETERLGAEQALARAREERRAVRDERAERLRQQDELANARRAARERLATAVYDEFRAAVAAVPGDAEPGAGPAEFAGDEVTAALAAARVAALDAPVVLACDRFRTAAHARRRLGAPVIRL